MSHKINKKISLFSFVLAFVVLVSAVVMTSCGDNDKGTDEQYISSDTETKDTPEKESETVDETEKTFVSGDEDGDLSIDFSEL